MQCLLSSAYLPPVEYFAAIAKYKNVCIEACENYQKQSYRNRCTILTASGKMNLNIPVSRGGDNFTHKVPIAEIEIDYSEDWVHRHIRALEAAYMNSPFFVYYKDDLFKILCSGERSLLKFNTLLTKQLLLFCGVRAEVNFTTDYLIPAASKSNNLSLKQNKADERVVVSEGKEPVEAGVSGFLDLRERIHPKSKQCSLLKEWALEKPYWQVFAKQGFVSNLSVVDLLFNEGPDSISFLL